MTFFLLMVVAVAPEVTQRVVVDGHAYERRAGYGEEYSVWEEVYLPPPGARSWTYKTDDWPKKVDQKTVQESMTLEWQQYFKVNNKAVRSGYYNLSSDPRYDWKSYAGIHWP